MFRFCILQTLYRVILNWPGSMDSIERRNSKNKPKTATLQLITSAHVWKKVYTLSLFLLTSFFFSLHPQFLQSSLVCQRGGALWRSGGKRKPKRDCWLLPIQSLTSLSSHWCELFYWGDWKFLRLVKPCHIYSNLPVLLCIKTRRIPLLYCSGKQNKHLHLCTIQCISSFSFH